MMRLLYQWLLWLHPPRFRREFAGEMLWIFESSADSEGTARLLSDAVASLARQWFLRSGSWKIGVALAGAALQVGLGSVGMLFATRPGGDSTLAATFKGTWSGRVESKAGVMPVELVFGRERGAWLGVFSAADRTSSIRDFQALREAVAFRVPAEEGDLVFRGHLASGKLRGTVERSGAGIGIWEVTRPTTSAAAGVLDTKRLVGLAAVTAAGICVAVVLLTLWARRFMSGRMGSLRVKK